MSEVSASRRASAIMFQVLFINDVACGAVVEAVAAVRRSGYYVRGVKSLVNRIEAWRHDYERKMRYIVGGKQEQFMTMCDEFEQGVAKDVNVFYWTIRNDYNRARVADTEVVARIQWARALCQLAAEAYTKCIEEVPTVFLRYFRWDYLDFRPMRKLWGRLIDEHFPASNRVESPQGQTAFDIICRKVQDAALIASAINAGVTEDDENWELKHGVRK